MVSPIEVMGFCWVHKLAQSFLGSFLTSMNCLRLMVTAMTEKTMEARTTPAQRREERGDLPARYWNPCRDVS